MRTSLLGTVWALTIGGLLALSLTSIRPVTSSGVGPSSCGIALTTSYSSGIGCEPQTVVASITTTCDAPRVNLVYVLPEGGVGALPGAAHFMEAAANGILDQLGGRSIDLQAATVAYDYVGTGRLEVDLTTDLSRVRRSFLMLREGGGGSFSPYGAVIESIGILDRARARHATTAEVIVMFGAIKQIH